MSDNDELKFMINEARCLSLSYEEQYIEMEEVARWNLPEEIAMEWIDAKGIIFSKELSSVITEEARQLLIQILSNFEYAFEHSKEEDVWSHDAMKESGFWDEQRKLAKQFLGLERRTEVWHM